MALIKEYCELDDARSLIRQAFERFEFSARTMNIVRQIQDESYLERAKRIAGWPRVSADMLTQHASNLGDIQLPS